MSKETSAGFKPAMFSGDAADYPVWKEQFWGTMVAAGYDAVVPFLVSSVPASLEDERASIVKTHFSDGTKATIANKRLYAFIIISLPKSTIGMLQLRVSMGDGFAAWVYLLNFYRPQTKVALHLVRMQLRELSLSSFGYTDAGIATYTATLLRLCSQLQDGGDKQNDAAQLSQWLAGLGSACATFVANVDLIDDSQDESMVSIPFFESKLRVWLSRQKQAEGTGTSVGALFAKTGPVKGKQLPSQTTQRPSGKKGDTKSKDSAKSTGLTCFNCGGRGHKSSNCPSPKSEGVDKQKGKSRPASGNAPSFACVSTVVDPPVPSSLVAAPTQSPFWIVDSGATTHQCHIREAFLDLAPLPSPVSVRIADSTVLPASGVGVVEINTFDTSGVQRSIRLSRCLFVPGLGYNLFSTKTATRHGATFLQTATSTTMTTPNGLTFKFEDRDGLDVFPATPPQDAQLALASTTKTALLHARWGHTTGVPQAAKDLDLARLTVDCESCAVTKSTRQGVPTKDERKPAQQPMDRLHGDLWGPVQRVSIQGHRFASVIIDDASDFTFVQTMSAKSGTLSHFRTVLAIGNARKLPKPRIVKSDNGGEYISADFKSFCLAEGIHQEFSTPRTPEQNGFVERRMRVLGDTTRALLKHSSLPPQFWNWAFLTAAYIYNRSTFGSHTTTPYERLFGIAPDLSLLRTWGCVVYVHADESERNEGKLSDRAWKGIFIGYSSNPGSYYVYKPTTRKVLERRVVRFDESVRGLTLLEDGRTDNDDGSDALMLLGLPSGPTDLASRTQTLPVSTPVVSVPLASPAPPVPVAPIASPSPSAILPVVTVPPVAAIIPEEGPIASRLRSSGPVSLMAQVYSLISEPRTLKQALKTPDADSWIEATEREYQALEANGTWDLVADKPPDRNVVGSRWVFKLKTSPTEPPLFKARLVAQGFSQVPGWDYEETFAPVMRLSSLRILVAVSTAYALDLQQLDIGNAYLNAPVAEEIYMKQPPGFERTGPNGEPLYCRLKKSLYGLKQSGRNWYETFSTYLLGCGFKATISDPCVFIHSGDVFFALGVYVDDVVSVCASKDVRDEFVARTRDVFKLKDIGELSWCLGLQVQRLDDGSVRLFQEKYISDMLTTYNLEDAHPTTLPIVQKPSTSDCPIDGSEEHEDMKKVPFRNLMGALNYASTCTRPDISFAVNSLCQMNSNPSVNHWTMAKGVLRYLKGTSDFGICFSPGDFTLEAYVDADWANDTERRKSVTGFVVFLAGGPIAWSSKKQSIVAVSSTEAEYVALSEVVKEVVYLRALLTEMGLAPSGPTTVYEDNHSAIKLSGNATSSKRTKHIDVRHHHVRDMVQAGEVEVSPIATVDQLADIFTKPLARPAFEYLRGSLTRP